MSSAERKVRAARTTAFTCGAMSLVAMATGVLVLAGGDAVAEQAPFGRAGSVAAVVIAMAALVFAMIVLGLAARAGRGLRQVAVAVTFLALAGLGVVAIGLLAGAPGAGFLLALAWVLAVPVPLQITRTPSEQIRRTS